MKASKITKETIRELGINKKRNIASFQVGDRVSVAQLVKEGNKQRVQAFEGDVIAINRNGASSTFTVRKIGANEIAVERIFPYESPLIESVKFLHSGRVRRAKLYYLRDRVGRSAQVAERVMTKEEKARFVRAQSADEAVRS
jgi:large subunit ribosomal protein L19